MAELLLEIFSEEIPARMQARAAEDLLRLVSEGLAKNGLSFDGARSYVTPRRLVLVIEGLPEETSPTFEEKKGPSPNAPDQAIAGFFRNFQVPETFIELLKRKGPRSGDAAELERIFAESLREAFVNVNQQVLTPSGRAVDFVFTGGDGRLYELELKVRLAGKSPALFAEVRSEGRPTAEVIHEVVAWAMDLFPWPKSQRWGANSVRWVRPLQSILCLFDGQVVPVSFGPITAGNVSRGHRFLAPAEFQVTDFADYATKLAAAKVVLDPVERRHSILRQAEEAAAREGFALRVDDGLLAEVTGLVELPNVLVGTIDDKFMAVPQEVLITSMRSHQKYFSALKADGSLAPRFLVVSNMETTDDGRAVVAGNQRVLRARLSDAAFFWDTDRKARLESRLPKLAERLFYARLGTMAEKVERMATLARHLTAFVEGAPADDAERAARLAKADLSTEMVGEFPELQGVMGRYYALHDGEKPAVADAIAGHYAPQGPSDAVPNAPLTICAALADKIDSLVGFFAIDEKPTGSKDPFALRRAALGVIRLVVENNLRLPLFTLFQFAHSLYPAGVLNSDPKMVANDLLDFFADRLKVHLKEKGVRHDLVNAVFALGDEDDLVRLLARVDALAQFLSSDDGANLLIAYRRAANIVKIEEKKDGASFAGPVDPSKLDQAEEKALAQALTPVRESLAHALKAENFADAMAALARLRQPVDQFFDKVTVNADNADLRVNRLKLLSEIGAAMGEVADFAKVEG